MSHPANRLATLSPAKRALLESMRAQAAKSEAGIPRAPDGPVPLTFEQRRMWFLHRLAPEEPLYTIPIGYRLEGALDASALQAALRAFVARHDALRMMVSERDGEPVQTASPVAQIGWETDDFADTADAEREGEAKLRVLEFLAQPFDLERGPLLRALLLRLGANEHLLAISIHHVAGDGWSTGILRRELGPLYAAQLAGRDAGLPALPAGFRDYAAWQRQALDGPALAADTAYWRGELEGAPQVFEPATDHPRPAAQAIEGFKSAIDLPPELTAELRALARAESTTLFAVLATAWAAVLQRHAGEDDFLVGTLEANRRDARTDAMFGFFANTVPLRFRLGGDPTVREAIGRTHRTVLGAREHARLPFDRIVELAGARRDPSRPPLVQSVVAFSDSGSVGLALPGVEAYPEIVDTGTSAFDLTLQLEDLGTTLRAELLVASALYEPATAGRLLVGFYMLLAGFVDDPARALADVELADEADALRWMADAEDEGPRPAPATLHSLFERQARIQPDAVAVAFGASGSVRYAVLNARANRIAHRLRRLGARPETRVGVCMRRTPDMVAALLGVLKSGAGYVPLDPGHPPARIEAVLRAARATAVLTDAASHGSVPAGGGMMVIDLDAAELGGENTADLEGGAEAASLAYVITTSGSTGGPKGVEITHASAASMLHWVRDTLDEEERACVLASTSILFDASVPEIFGTLSWGGTLVLVENALSPLPPSARPRAAAMVPSVAAELLRDGRLPPSLGTLLLGGEVVTPALARALHATGTVTRVLNLYGPSEDTTYSTCAAIPLDTRRVTIGRSIARCRSYVLDERLRPVPIGVPGEIWVAGDGVARGYVGRPSLTAARFFPDPWGPPGARMYRTLDLGRRLDDGALEYLGRRDAQVKVHGVRIEASEVEDALLLLPSVTEAAVDARDDGNGGKRLIAWLVADGGDRPTPAELREHLRERLPEAMVPSVFAWTGPLPRTAGGKVDRRALPDPAVESAATEPVAPRTELEAKLAEIWAGVLGLERVGVEDDFFDLGGQSLVATRLAARIRAELGRELPLALLLRASTVARLAASLASGREEVRPPLIALHPHGVARPLFLGPPGGGHVVCYRKLAALLAPGIPVFGLQARGIDDGQTPMQTVREIAGFFVDAVREAQPEGPYHLGGWSFGGMVAFEMGRLLCAAGAEVGLVAMLDTSIPGARDPEETLDHVRVLQRIIADLVGWAAAGAMRLESLRALPPREQALEAVRQVRQKALPESRVDEILSLTAVRQANLRALVSYDPEPYPGELTYFRTAASERALPKDGAVDFWGSRALGGMTLHRIGGSHGSILEQPYVADVAARLAAAVRRPLVAV
ncbi:amino acid adenylation domain-containing protein [bacterium JGI 053]|nr:amino acid adenylation domain-containing protein [bacterium JGI 053]